VKIKMKMKKFTQIFIGLLALAFVLGSGIVRLEASPETEFAAALEKQSAQHAADRAAATGNMDQVLAEQAKERAALINSGPHVPAVKKLMIKNPDLSPADAKAVDQFMSTNNLSEEDATQLVKIKSKKVTPEAGVAEGEVAASKAQKKAADDAAAAEVKKSLNQGLYDRFWTSAEETGHGVGTVVKAGGKAKNYVVKKITRIAKGRDYEADIAAATKKSNSADAALKKAQIKLEEAKAARKTGSSDDISRANRQIKDANTAIEVAKKAKFAADDELSATRAEFDQNEAAKDLKANPGNSAKQDALIQQTERAKSARANAQSSKADYVKSQKEQAKAASSKKYKVQKNADNAADADLKAQTTLTEAKQALEAARKEANPEKIALLENKLATAERAAELETAAKKAADDEKIAVEAEAAAKDAPKDLAVKTKLIEARREARLSKTNYVAIHSKEIADDTYKELLEATKAQKIAEQKLATAKADGKLRPDQIKSLENDVKNAKHRTGQATTTHRVASVTQVAAEDEKAATIAEDARDRKADELAGYQKAGDQTKVAIAKAELKKLTSEASALRWKARKSSFKYYRELTVLKRVGITLIAGKIGFGIYELKDYLDSKKEKEETQRDIADQAQEITKLKKEQTNQNSTPDRESGKQTASTDEDEAAYQQEIAKLKQELDEKNDATTDTGTDATTTDGTGADEQSDDMTDLPTDNTATVPGN